MSQSGRKTKNTLGTCDIIPSATCDVFQSSSSRCRWQEELHRVTLPLLLVKVTFVSTIFPFCSCIRLIIHKEISILVPSFAFNLNFQKEAVQRMRSEMDLCNQTSNAVSRSYISCIILQGNIHITFCGSTKF